MKRILTLPLSLALLTTACSKEIDYSHKLDKFKETPVTECNPGKGGNVRACAALSDEDLANAAKDVRIGYCAMKYESPGYTFYVYEGGSYWKAWAYGVSGAKDIAGTLRDHLHAGNCGIPF